MKKLSQLFSILLGIMLFANAPVMSQTTDNTTTTTTRSADVDDDDDDDDNNNWGLAGLLGLLGLAGLRRKDRDVHHDRSRDERTRATINP